MSRKLALLLLLVSFHARSHTTGTFAPRAIAPTGDKEIGEIFRTKCVVCHKKKGIFDKDTYLPTKDWKDEVIRRIKLPSSDSEKMPPEDKTQLTESEKTKIYEWAKK